MLYNEVVELIKSVCETVNQAGTFIHGKRVDGSFIYDKPFPQIHLYPFRTSKDVVNGNDVHTLLMGFWHQDSGTSSPEERQALIAKADELCNAFIAEMVNRSQLMQGVVTEPQYQTLAATVSGYALSFTLTTKSDDC